MTIQNKIDYNKEYYKKNKQKILDRSSKRYKDNRIQILQQHKISHKKRDIKELLIERAKQRAKKNNIPFNITKEDIILPKKCPVLGIKLSRNVGGKTANSNSYSIDKIIPSKGYVKGNIQVISYKANAMKNNANNKELIRFANWILSNKLKGGKK
jgi:hypothetical protein